MVTFSERWVFSVFTNMLKKCKKYFDISFVPIFSLFRTILFRFLRKLQQAISPLRENLKLLPSGILTQKGQETQ